MSADTFGWLVLAPLGGLFVTGYAWLQERGLRIRPHSWAYRHKWDLGLATWITMECILLPPSISLARFWRAAPVGATLLYADVVGAAIWWTVEHYRREGARDRLRREATRLALRPETQARLAELPPADLRAYLDKIQSFTPEQLAAIPPPRIARASWRRKLGLWIYAAWALACIIGSLLTFVIKK